MQYKLKKSVLLYNLIPGDESGKRVFLSDGVCAAPAHEATGTRYVESAYIPHPPWRSPTKEEENILFTRTAPSDYGAALGIMCIPSEIRHMFDQLKLNEAQNQDEFYGLIKSERGKVAVQCVEDYVRSFLEKDDEFRTVTVYNSPGVDFTAYAPTLGGFMGLHIDYLNNQSIYDRGTTANRISINMGREDRYLVYINLTMNDLIELTNPPEGCSNDEIVMVFLKRFSNYPVIKVKVSPGEAYIAPTQNIIHDGVGSKNSPDFHLTICGHISISKAQYNIEKLARLL